MDNTSEFLFYSDFISEHDEALSEQFLKKLNTSREKNNEVFTADLYKSIIVEYKIISKILRRNLN